MARISFTEIKKIFAERGLTEEILIRDGVLDHETYQKIMNETNIWTDVLDRLCQYLDCDIRELIEYEK